MQDDAHEQIAAMETPGIHSDGCVCSLLTGQVPEGKPFQQMVSGPQHAEAYARPFKL